MAMSADMPHWVSENEENKELKSKSEIEKFLMG